MVTTPVTWATMPATMMASRSAAHVITSFLN
jgi:hypothetical protein